MERYPIYKGLEQPLSYRGLKGKFIGWGICSLICGLFAGGIIGALSSMYLGALFTAVLSGGGFSYTLYRQKRGLYDKKRDKGIFVHQNSLSL